MIFAVGTSAYNMDQYVAGWQPEGVHTIMAIPFINGRVLEVPDTIISAELADDPRVASVQEDKPVSLQALTASGDGAAGDGAAGDGAAGDGAAGDGAAADDGTIASPYPVMYPAAYPQVIAVGAINAFENRADFSNTGPEVDLLAAGTNLYSTDMGGGYGICSGTSMATPHVTGAVAMMMALALDERKTLSPAEIAAILKRTAQNGVINVQAALEEVLYTLQ